MIYQEKEQVVYRDPETGNQTRATVVCRNIGFPEFYLLKAKEVNSPLFRYIVAKPDEIIGKFEIKEN